MTPKFSPAELELFDTLVYYTLFHDDADDVVDGVLAMMETETECEMMLQYINLLGEKITVSKIIDYAFKIENARFGYK